MQNSIPWDMRSFLDRIEIPVLIVDPEGTIVLENSAARDVTGKESVQIEGFKGGDVFDCVHSFEIGGCGNTIHCKACTIRQSVNETFSSGKPVYRRPASLRVVKKGADFKIESYITTILADHVVILYVEDIQINKL